MSRRRPGHWLNGPWPSTEAAHGPDHPTVGVDLSILASILQDLGEPGRGPASGRTGPGDPGGGSRPRPPEDPRGTVCPPPSLHRHQGDTSSDQGDAVLAYWREHREQLRQSETQRAVLTNYVLVIASALTGLAVQNKLAHQTWPLAVLVFLVGVYGAATVAKYHERADYHLSQARPLTKTLTGLSVLRLTTLCWTRLGGPTTPATRGCTGSACTPCGPGCTAPRRFSASPSPRPQSQGRGDGPG